MRVITVPLAQSAKAVRPSRSFGYLPDAVKAVVAQYKFVEFPSHPHELFPVDSTQVIVFRHGKLDVQDRTIVIDYLQVFQLGLAVSTSSHTSDSDLVLSHILEWTATVFNINFETLRPLGHLSQLEITFNRRLSDALGKLRPVASKITAGIDDFYAVKPRYELTGMTFHFDTTTINPSVAPAAVKIEARQQLPFKENLYFSEAPLTTDKHIELLEDFKRTCMSLD